MNLFLKKSVNFVLFSSSGILLVIKFIASSKLIYIFPGTFGFLSSTFFSNFLIDSIFSSSNTILPTAGRSFSSLHNPVGASLSVRPLQS